MITSWVGLGCFGAWMRGHTPRCWPGTSMTITKTQRNKTRNLSKSKHIGSHLSWQQGTWKPTKRFLRRTAKGTGDKGVEGSVSFVVAWGGEEEENKEQRSVCVVSSLMYRANTRVVPVSIP